MKKFVRIFSFFAALAFIMPFVSCSNSSDSDDGKIRITYKSGIYEYNSNLEDFVQITAVQSVMPNESIKLKTPTELGWDNLRFPNKPDFAITSWFIYISEFGGYSCAFDKTVSFSEDVTIEANWGELERTRIVTFNANGGQITTETQSSVKSDFSLDTAKTLGLYRLGYTFKGWSKSESAESVDFEDGASVTISDDITLYAVWEENPKWTVTFNANSGTIVTESQIIVQDVSTALEKAETLGLARDGFIFKGWAKNSTATKIEYSDGAKITVSENTTLYAIWAYTATYTITFDVGEGSIATNSQSETAETITGEISATLKTENTLELSRTGYKFKGWATSNSSSTVAYTDGKSITLSSDITLYAIWDKIVTYTITYDVNGGYTSSYSLTESVTGTESDGATLTLKTASKLGFSKSGYVFAGWSELSYASYASFTDGANVIVRGNTTFYAVWVLPTYTITYKQTTVFNSSSQTETYTEGDTIYLPTAETLGLGRKGYEFLGWSTSSGGFNSSPSVDYKAGSTIKASKNLTLYAVWQEIYIYVQLYHPGYSSTTEKLGSPAVSIGGESKGFSLSMTNKTYTSTTVKLAVSGSQAWATSFSHQKNGKTTTETQSGYMTFVNGGTYRINIYNGNVSKIK